MFSNRCRILAVLAVMVSSNCLCFAEEGGRSNKEARKEDRAYDERLKQQYETNANRSGGAEQKYKTEAEKKRAEQQKKEDLADFKEKSKSNLADIKELFQKAEAAWKQKEYRLAGPYYQSVALATVTGAEDMTETSRGRLIEMEDMAKALLKDADDSDLQRDFGKEVDQLASVMRDFKLTSSKDVALRRLVNLKTRPDVAAMVEYSQAETMENDGKLTEALNGYNSIINNPRYEHSMAVLKATRRVEELNKDEKTKDKVRKELDARADKEGPSLITAAKNFKNNNMPKKAIEKLQSVVEKFPGTLYEREAQRLLQEMQ